MDCFTEPYDDDTMYIRSLQIQDKSNGEEIRLECLKLVLPTYHGHAYDVLIELSS
jgi:hypothetical protein